MSGTDGVDKIGQAVEDIGAYIRRQREGAQVSLRQLAKVAGISNPYLSQIERGLRKPSAEILSQIATGLRISAEALYVRAGILEPREYSPVLDALTADPDLTERQKQGRALSTWGCGRAPPATAGSSPRPTGSSDAPGTEETVSAGDEADEPTDETDEVAAFAAAQAAVRRSS